METLFGDQLIMSIAYKQDELLQAILQLHVKQSTFHCDVTFNAGGFYKKIPRPELTFDIAPQDKETEQADYRFLPVEHHSITSLVWDPPFVCGTHVKSRTYIMGERYSMYRNIAELEKDYAAAMESFNRVVQHKGWLIVKCQDTVHGRKNYFNHILVHNLAIENNFRPIDLFILLSKNRFSSTDNQVHSRKFHSYFWVFKKWDK
mgnify:CR=1 FL=1